MAIFKPKDDSHEFKPLLVEIEEAPRHPLGGIVFWTVIAAMLFFSLWMFLGKVDVVVSARGKIIPVGEIKILQPLTTGVVSNILVKEGDFVKKGMILMEIDPSSTLPELESMKANLKQMNLEVSRINALLDNIAFEPDPTLYQAAVVRTQKELYQSTVDRLQKQLDIRKQELNQIDEQVASTRRMRAQSLYLANLSQRRLERLEPVRDIISKDEYDKAESEYKTNRNNVKLADHKLDELLATRRRILREIEFVKEDERNKLLSEMAEKREKQVYLQANIEKTSYYNAKQQIVSPVDGYINKLLIHTIGGVVSPAEKVIAIVPTTSDIIVKAMVQNKDIGFVAENMDASIKVDTFSFQKYGVLKGTVTQVAKDSLEDKNLGLVYEVYVKPHDTMLMVEGKATQITTGMGVTTEIKVGKRRIIEFFIYPLIKYLDEGISVR